MFATPAWLLMLATVVAILQWAGNGPLALPTFESAAIDEWLRVTTPVTITLAVLRAISLIVATYLLVCTSLAAIAESLRSRLLARLVHAISLPPVRRLNRRVVELSMVGVLVIPSAASASPINDDVPVLRNLSPASTPEQVVAIPAPVVAGDETWTVERGENLWVIAESALAKRLGRQPTEAEITPFWAALVQENQARLVDVDNPDIVFAGQEFKLPR